MASPQLERGHCRLANELLDALIANPPIFVAARQVWDWIWRNSWGIKGAHQTVPMSVRDLAEELGISKTKAARAVQYLITTKRITRNPDNSLSIQKDHEKWLVVDKINQPKPKQLQLIPRHIPGLIHNNNHRGTGKIAEKQEVSRKPGQSFVVGKEYGVPKTGTASVPKTGTKASRKPGHPYKVLKKGKKESSRPSDQNGVEFEVFWNAYPRKIARLKAESSWRRIRPDNEVVAVIMASLERYKRCDQWVGDEGRFIPHAATWLNQRRWDDEVPVVGVGMSATAATARQCGIGRCSGAGAKKRLKPDGSVLWACDGCYDTWLEIEREKSDRDRSGRAGLRPVAAADLAS